MHLRCIKKTRAEVSLYHPIGVEHIYQLQS
jgi:hypothetical protein